MLFKLAQHEPVPLFPSMARAETVRAAREPLRPERIDGLKERVSKDGGFAASSKALAQRVLATKV